MSPSHVERTLALKQAQHPELTAELRWFDLQTILQREGIRLIHKPLPDRRLGMLVGYLGAWTIIVSTSTSIARWNYVVLHELAHLWLHQDPTGRDEQCFAFGCDTTDDREIEAENFVSMIMNPECWR